MRPAVPLSIQLLLTFVGLLVGITFVLTRAADTILLTSLEADARRNVELATRTREQALTQLFQLRHQRAVGFLKSVESLCAEPVDHGRIAWVSDCVRTMVDDFRRSERATGALLAYRGRRLRRSGRPVSNATLATGALATVVRRREGAIEYLMKATSGDITLALHFDHAEVARLFVDQSDLGRAGDVFLLSDDGQLLTPTRSGSTSLSPSQAVWLVQKCGSATDSFIDADYRGVTSIQSFRPVSAFGAGCVAASVGHDETVAPARRLRADLVGHGAWFVIIGAILSLVAARWISAPVTRLAISARNLQVGKFDRPIPLAGPREVRALGRAFNAMANDLAELVAKEQAARREAEAANRAKDDFLGTVSHELRTPLTAVVGWAKMLKSGRLPAEEVHHALDVIERSATAQTKMIEELLDVSRIVSNRLTILREPVRLAHVIEGALDTIRPEAEAKQVQLEARLLESAVVLGDPQRLEQVVWNLAWNAIKFSQPGGRITVELTQVERELTLSVADTGIGISAAFLPHVFEWFRQADPRLLSQSGLGLGLGIVRRLVQLHGGRVRAESRGEGHGATFIVTLPAHEAAGAALSSPGTAARNAPA